MHEEDKSNLLRMMLGEVNREWRELSRNKPMPLLVMLPLLFTILATPAHSQTPTEPMRRTWELCQGGDLASCNRLLRLPIDDETRALVEIDRQQAIDRRLAYARVLASLCARRTNTRACDRALLYELPATHRAEIVALRKAVMLGQPRVSPR